jgi:SAM-dependent methyltransferase
MLAELRRAAPGVRALPGRAEAIPLPDASVDAVLAGQALHWFDMSLAAPEITRVLAPGGVLAGLWNVDDDREDWVAGLARASDGGAMTISAWNTEPVDAEPGPRWPFTPPERADFPHGHRHTADSLTATIATHSRLLARPAPDRARLLAEIRSYLSTRPETASGEFTLPMITIAIRATRP